MKTYDFEIEDDDEDTVTSMFSRVRYSENPNEREQMII